MQFIQKFEEIDFSPLERKVTSKDIIEYRKQIGRKIPLSVIRIAMGIMWLMFLVAITGLLMMGDLAENLPSIGWPGLIATGISIVYLDNKKKYRTEIRLANFASKNNLAYDKLSSNQLAGNGLVFDVGHDKAFENLIYQTEGGEKIFEIGRYRYTIGHGKDKQVYHWAYACLRMKSKLPHMVLDAKENNFSLFSGLSITNLPKRMTGMQKIRLEGNFNDHFTLFGPKGYDIDARYIFTPDIMALLIDESVHFDVEIVDDRIYFYQRVSSGWSHERSLKEFMRLVDILGQKFYRRTDNYQDHRKSDPEIQK